MQPQIVDVDGKLPGEDVGYVIDWSRDIPDTETLNAFAWNIYDASSPTVSVYSAMNGGYDLSDANRTSEVDVKAGTDGHTYLVLAQVSCSSGRIYQKVLRLKVTALGGITTTAP